MRSVPGCFFFPVFIGTKEGFAVYNGNESRDKEARRDGPWLSLPGDLRPGPWPGDPDRRDFSGGCGSVLGGVSVDLLWLCLPAQIERRFL